MKAVILAGGLGTRLSEETHLKPKPMVEIGNMPILWHIMKLYSAYGVNEFIICLGYKGSVIKEFFRNYHLLTSDITINTSNNDIEIINKKSEDWKIHLIETGLNTMIGGRIKRILPLVEKDEFFFLTYGDGVSDINISKEIEHHRNSQSLVTMAAVQPPGRFGAIKFDSNDNVVGFQEKPTGDGSWINGGFFICSPKVGEYIKNDSTVWEREPLENIAKEGKLTVFKHSGFWHPMDTLRDKVYLENLWNSGKSPWKVW